jgi:hypothetical protein
MQFAAPAVSGHCPFLGESLMQYCGAAPVAKMVPYSETCPTGALAKLQSEQYCS